MAKLLDLLDQLPELDKRVYALQLLSGVDVSSLNDKDFNSWIGLLYDTVDLLSNTATDMRLIGKSLSNQS